MRTGSSSDSALPDMPSNGQTASGLGVGVGVGVGVGDGVAVGEELGVGLGDGVGLGGGDATGGVADVRTQKPAPANRIAIDVAMMAMSPRRERTKAEADNSMPRILASCGSAKDSSAPKAQHSRFDRRPCLPVACPYTWPAAPIILGVP